MRRLLLGLSILAAVPALAQRQPAAQFQPRQEDVATFPDLPGRDETFGYCSACHAFRLVAAQGMTREQWESALTWMSDRHSMPPLDDADRKVILDYLAGAFPPNAQPTVRGGWRSPFQPQ